MSSSLWKGISGCSVHFLLAFCLSKILDTLAKNCRLPSVNLTQKYLKTGVNQRFSSFFAPMWAVSEWNKDCVNNHLVKFTERR